MQLTYPPMEVWTPFISPDGTKVAFTSMSDGSIIVVDMNGDVLHKISRFAGGPQWSPDGTLLVIDKSDGSRHGLQIVDVATWKMSEIPSSMNNSGAFWLDQETNLPSKRSLHLSVLRLLSIR